MIRVEGVSKHFGGICAVDNIDLEISRGSITGLIGPNGAGKTTLFNLISGLYSPSSGSIHLDGDDVTGLTPHELFEKGLLRTFQLSHEFSTLTVLENLMVVPPQSGENIWTACFRRGLMATEERQIQEKAMDVLEFLHLSDLRNELAGNLSGGQKKLLELGRTMMVEAKIVLLDEVGAGVNRTLLSHIGDSIERLRHERGYTFCMIEHDMDFIGRLCDPVIVMSQGAKLTEGKMSSVSSDERVMEAYLGRSGI